MRSRLLNGVSPVARIGIPTGSGIYLNGNRILTLQDADANFNYSATISAPGKYRIHAWGAGGSNAAYSGSYGSMDVVLNKLDIVSGKISSPYTSGTTQGYTTVIAAGRTMSVPSGWAQGGVPATGGDVGLAGSAAGSAGIGTYGGPAGFSGNATGGAGAPSATPLLRGGQGGSHIAASNFNARNGPVGFPAGGGCGIYSYGSGYTQGNEHSTGGGAAILLEYLGPA